MHMQNAASLQQARPAHCYRHVADLHPALGLEVEGNTLQIFCILVHHLPQVVASAGLRTDLYAMYHGALHMAGNCMNEITSPQNLSRVLSARSNAKLVCCMHLRSAHPPEDGGGGQHGSHLTRLPARV